MITAVFPHPLDFYMHTRTTMTGAAVILVVLVLVWQRPQWLFGLVPIALLWNPIAPIYLDRSTWIVLDLAAAGLFAALAWSVYKQLRAPSAKQADSESDATTR